MTEYCVYGYDDTPVTLGDGTIAVDGMRVSGSVQFVRDPRLGRLADTLGRLKATWMMRQPSDTIQMCSCKTHQGARWLPIRAFAQDRTRPENGGLDVYCRTCRNRLDKDRRAVAAELQGRKLRKWERRRKPATLRTM